MSLGESVRWTLTTDQFVVATIREVITSALAVLAVGAILVSVSGVWPPLVAVESGSMEPVMQAGDLVFLVDSDRFVPNAAQPGTGVVTAAAGAEAGYRRFDAPGDVIIYESPKRDGSPIIHRAMFWVDDGENWYDRADSSAMSARNCEQLTGCPAPHAGFITKGDANGAYDQAQGLAPPVRPAWVTGTAEARLPWLGWIRLCLTQPGRCPFRDGSGVQSPRQQASAVDR